MIIGIDLGTTNSLVGIWRNGEPVLIPNALGSLLTPSAISIDDGTNVATFLVFALISAIFWVISNVVLIRAVRASLPTLGGDCVH